MPSPARRRPRWLAFVLVPALVAALVVSAAMAWDWHRRPAGILAALPALPDGSGQPPELRQRLESARTAALDRAGALDGIAELGRLFHANGFSAEAGACWKLLQAEQPRNALWCYYLADLRRVAGDYDGMAALLERTTTLAPAYAPAWLQLAGLHFKRGQLVEAGRAYRERLALLPDDPYARLGLARVSLQEGRQEEAREQIEQLVEEVPAFPPARNLYAELLAAGGDETRAARERLRGSEAGRFRDADDPWLDELIDWCFDYEKLCVRGTMEVLTGRGDRGKSLFERAIKLRPDAFAAYELLGDVYLDLKDGGRARENYEAALRFAPETKPSARFHANLSRAYVLLQQPAEAVRLARDGLARAGESAGLFDALGDALGALGESEAAVEALRAAVDLGPGDAHAHYKHAVALLAVHRLEDAIAALQRSLAAQPAFPSTLALLAQIEIDSGRWQSAVQYLQLLYESHPELAEAREKMVVAYLGAGAEAERSRDLPAAEHHYRAGLAIEHDHAELQARLGALCLIQRRFADAVAPLEAYHRLEPGNPQSALFLGQAYGAVGRREEAREILIKGAQLAERAGNSATAQRCREILQRLP